MCTCTTRPTRPSYREYTVTVSNGMGGRTISRWASHINPFHSWAEARTAQRRTNDATSRIEYRDSALGEWQPLLMLAHHGECGAACSPESCPVLMSYARGEGQHSDYLCFLLGVDGEGEESAAAEVHTPEADEESHFVGAYSFYVGSSDTHAAHSRPADGSPLAAVVSRMGYARRAYGVWEGEHEEISIYRGVYASDAEAQRVAYALAILTGNACVMVTRDLTQTDIDRSLASVRAYRVTAEAAENGNRTILSSGSSTGYRFERDVRGETVAYLVHSDASVSAVS
jgi:hypothetical protein